MTFLIPNLYLVRWIISILSTRSGYSGVTGPSYHYLENIEHGEKCANTMNYFLSFGFLVAIFINYLNEVVLAIKLNFMEHMENEFSHAQ